MNRKKRCSYKISSIIKGIAAVILLGSVVYIMVHHLGLVDSLDFGAGAYYYADIPGFAKLVNNSLYTSETPMWVLILLFLAWGALMYRLWTWLEKKIS